MNYNIIDIDQDTRLIKISDYYYDKLVSSGALETEQSNILLYIAVSHHCANKPLHIIDLVKEQYPRVTVAILANTREEQQYYQARTNNPVIYCNNNAFVNYNLFKPTEGRVLKYDMLINSRFCRYKHNYLGRLCNGGNGGKGVAHIGYFSDKEEYVFPKFGTYLNFGGRDLTPENYQFISPQDVVGHINSSMCVGIFSNVEGACRASSEALLCGVPVISTKSRGGRDVWYTRHNSVVCDSSVGSVRRALEEVRRRFARGEFNATKIREDHMNESKQHVNRLFDHIESVLGRAINREALEVQLLHADMCI